MKWCEGTDGSHFGRKGRLWSLGWHTGTDVIAARGTLVRVPFWNPGMKVLETESVSWGSAYGRAVIIYVRPGVRYLVAHLDSVAVRPGDKIKRGSILGRVGNTGNSTGPHLHVEKRVGPHYRFGTDSRKPQMSA